MQTLFAYLYLCVRVCVRARMSVYLLVKVGFSELQRVEQGVGSSQFHIVTGLLLPHALDYGCQDLVGVFLQLFWVLKEKTGSQILDWSRDHSFTLK